MTQILHFKFQFKIITSHSQRATNINLRLYGHGSLQSDLTGKYEYKAQNFENAGCV